VEKGSPGFEFRADYSLIVSADLRDWISSQPWLNIDKAVWITKVTNTEHMIWIPVCPDCGPHDLKGPDWQRVVMLKAGGFRVRAMTGLHAGVVKGKSLLARVEPVTDGELILPESKTPPPGCLSRCAGETIPGYAGGGGGTGGRNGNCTVGSQGFH
jgi:hypothetical protein